MAKLWRGVLTEYADLLPANLTHNIVTLQEGGTPLIEARAIAEQIGNGVSVWLKFEGANPTGSFKDRGMTAAITDAKNAGSQAVVCASTGNTSASAAAYSAQAGLTCSVLVPQGKIAMGKLAQAIAHNAKVIQIDGNFDDCLVLARKLAENYLVTLVNSINPARMQGQKTAAFEIVDQLGRFPDIHCIPVGNAGNITAYWMGFQEYCRKTHLDTDTVVTTGTATAADAPSKSPALVGYLNGRGVGVTISRTNASDSDTATDHTANAGSTANDTSVVTEIHSATGTVAAPTAMWGFQAEGAAPLVDGYIFEHPETIASAIRIGNPARAEDALAAVSESQGLLDKVSDTEILAAQKLISNTTGVFCEPASAASIAGLLKSAKKGLVPANATITATLTGHGLKDPSFALQDSTGAALKPIEAPNYLTRVATLLGL
ncbi:MAG: threonine synthase [Bifidobacteriaceae bacterium]|jgi:threonine synthase|nr:threonine synthase [Bifidobacteriaceae bacterium]